MAEHDRIEKATGEAPQRRTVGTTAQVPRIERWLAEIESQRNRASQLRNLLRNYRVALDGPVPEVSEAANVQTLDVPQNYSKLTLMDEAIASLELCLTEALDEMSCLVDLAVVDSEEVSL